MSQRIKTTINTISTVIYQIIICASLIWFVLFLGATLTTPIEQIPLDFHLALILFILSTFVMFHLVYRMGKDAGHDELFKKLKKFEFYNPEDEPKN